MNHLLAAVRRQARPQGLPWRVPAQDVARMAAPWRLLALAVVRVEFASLGLRMGYLAALLAPQPGPGQKEKPLGQAQWVLSVQELLPVLPVGCGRALSRHDHPTSGIAGVLVDLHTIRAAVNLSWFFFVSSD